MKTKHKNSKYFKLFIVLIIIGFISSYIYFNNIKSEDLNIIINNVKESNILLNPINNITNHLKILSVISIFSVIFIGLFISFGLIISEGFDLFFRTLLLYKIYKFNGILYALIYYLINNLIYLLILYIIFKKVILISKKIYKYKIKKEVINLNEIYLLIIKILYLIIFIFINDIIINLYGSKILKLFAFFIK